MRPQVGDRLCSPALVGVLGMMRELSLFTDSLLWMYELYPWGHVYGYLVARRSGVLDFIEQMHRELYDHRESLANARN